MEKSHGSLASKKNLLLWISIPAIIGLGAIIFLSIVDVIQSDQPLQAPPFTGRPFLAPYRGAIRSEIFWLFSLLSFVGIVPFTYYFISKKLEDKIDKNMKILSKVLTHEQSSVAEGNSSKNSDYKNVFLKFLNFNERKVLEKLIEGKGEEIQAKISRMEGMNKLKTHRAVRDLERKGIIKTESYGKTKKIFLIKDVRDAFFKI